MHDDFLAKLTERVKDLKVGDPMDKATRTGPVISKAQMDAVLGYIESGEQEGARLVAGGGRARSAAARAISSSRRSSTASPTA